MDEPATFSVWRLLLGILLGAVGHVVAVGAGLLAAEIVQPTVEGFQDLAAAIVTFLAVEALVLVALVITAVRQLAKRRRDLVGGLFLGWLAGVIFFVASR